MNATRFQQIRESVTASNTGTVVPVTRSSKMPGRLLESITTNSQPATTGARHGEHNMRVKSYSIPEVKLLRISEAAVDNPLLDNPEAVAQFWRENVPNAVWYDMDCETLVVLLLNTRRRIVGFERVTQGTMDTLLIHPREVFKTAIVQGAAAIVLMHNHPSGDPTPSEADIRITRDLIKAGQLLKIDVLDHVIIGLGSEQRPAGYTSLRELGYFYA